MKGGGCDGALCLDLSEQLGRRYRSKRQLMI